MKEEDLQTKNQVELNEMDERKKDNKYEKLISILNNSTKLTKLFETRIKKCKLQIIKKELENTNMKENVLNSKVNSTMIKNEDIDEEEYYLSLFKQPTLFEGNLKTHQVEGLLWIRTLFENGLNGILADDMGLGKTIQVIAFYCFLIEMGISGPFLVIVPLSTVPNWLSEFAKFAPQLPTLLYHGTVSERIQNRFKFKDTSELVNNLICCKIVISTYDIVRTDIQHLKHVDWKYITIDEGHMLKNFNTNISISMRQFSCKSKLILTGTPIQNNMDELWSLLNLLMPNIFDKLEDFNSWFVIDDFFSSNDKIASMAKKDEILEIILKILKPFILKRDKIETDLNLPQKKEIVVYAPITEVQQELYKATLNKHMEILLKKEKDSNDILGNLPKRKCVQIIKKYSKHAAIKNVPEQKETESKNVAISVIMQNPFMQLKKIANHPYLVHLPLIPGTKNIIVDENIVKVSGKFQVLDAMLTKLKLLGHKVLLFSTMTQILDVIEEFLIFRTFKYTRLDGSMKIETRVEAMKTFNMEPDYFLMILSTRAGGVGLNLTAADTVIIFDSDWNPQSDLQAQNRCHRMGQEKPVVVYRLCSKNTVDEKILERASAKRKLEKIIMGSGSFNRNTKITKGEVEDLMALLESSDYHKKIQSNGFIFTDEELDTLLDRSDMVDSVSNINVAQSAKHFKVMNTS